MELAVTPDTPAKTTNPRHRSIKRVLTGLLVVVVLIGGSLAAMLSTRPPWHVITGSGKPGQWVASVECPDNWQIEDEQNKQSYAGVAALTVRRKPLTGIWAWWNQYVLHQPQNDSNTELRIFVMPHPLYKGMRALSLSSVSHAEHIRNAAAMLDGWEAGYKIANLRGSGFKTTFKRIGHPLGPALVFSMDDMRIGNRGAGAANTAGAHYTTLNIAPTEAEDFSGSVIVSYNRPEASSALKPIMERMARSIRLVKR